MTGYSNYPDQIDTSSQLPIVTDNVTPVKAEVVNRLRDAILSIENELGVDPSREFGTVRDRLDAITSSGSGGGSVEILQNGSQILSSAIALDFTGNVIVNAAQPFTAEINVIGGQTIQVQETFVATAGQTVFILSKLPVQLNAVMMFVNGIKQIISDYNVVNNSVSYAGNIALVNGDNIEFWYLVDVSGIPQIGPQGPVGPQGISAYTTVASDFIQPVSLATVIVNVVQSGWMTPGQIIFIGGGGYYLVDLVLDATHILVHNLGYSVNANPGVTVTVGKNVVPGGLIGPAGPQFLDSITERFTDPNSLVNGNLDHVSWIIGVKNPPATRVLAGDSTVSGLRSLVYINSDGYCVSDGYLSRPVTIPTGVTGIQIQLDEVQLPIGIVSTANFALALFDASGITQISSTSFAVTGTATNVATTTITVVSGIEYQVRVICNVSGSQSQFLAGKLRVIPTVTSNAGIFGSSFKRLEVYGCIQNTDETIWYNPRYCPQNEFSFIEFNTNSNFVIEYYNSSGNYIGTSRAAITPQVDNFPLDPPIVPIVVGGINYADITLPSITFNGPRNVKIPAGPAVSSLFGGIVAEDSGTFISAIYVASSSYLQVVANPTDLAVVYGDSKEAGFYSDSPGRDSMTFMLRRNNWSVSSISKGGGAIFADCPTLSVAGCKAFAMKLARRNPSRIYIEIGRNDFYGGVTAANIVTQIGNLCDAINAVLPACNVVITTWTSETTENSIGGVAWDTERANIVALVSSRSPWCTYLDEARYWTPAEAVNFTSDTVHPNSLGYERKTRGRINAVVLQGTSQYPWSPLELTPTVWLESLSAMTGGTAGTITSSGTSPPSVTITGSAAIACFLRVEITIGGTRGNALFRWSIDGGRSWIAQNVATAATVVINPLGVTLNFASGSYSNDNVYTCSFKVAQWNDLSGNGNHFIQGTDANRPLFNNNAYGSLPGVTFGATSSMSLSGLSFSNPYTLGIVAIADAHTLLAAPVSPTSGASYGPLLYVSSTSPKQIALNDSVAQLAANCDTSALHTMVVVSNGASSSVRIDGTATTGTLGAGTSSQTLYLGVDVPNGVFWNGSIMAFILVPRAMSSSECLNLEARWRSMYRTP